MLPSESGHFYYTDGRPCYEVPNKSKGGTRPTTIRDARLMKLVPGVTTIIKCAAAPGLENWKVRQAILASLTLPRIHDEDDDAWIARIVADSKEQAAAAAERGTIIHAAVEAGLRGEWINPEFATTVDIVRKTLDSWFGVQLWLPEKSFSYAYLYGGKVDIHSPNVLLDVKSKDGDLANEKLWDEHFMQMAAYGKGLRLPDDARYGILFVSRTDPKKVRIVEASKDEVARGWGMFSALLSYWRHKNDFA